MDDGINIPPLLVWRGVARALLPFAVSIAIGVAWAAVWLTIANWRWHP